MGETESSKPFVFDLFCGLRKTQIGRRTNLLIQKLVACGAENPNHMGMAVFDFSPRPISSVLRSVRYLNNTILAARLARCWKIGKFSLQSLQKSVFVRPSRIVKPLYHWILFVERLPLLLRCDGCAIGGAIAPIAVRINYAEVIAANLTISASFQNISNFISLYSAKKITAVIRAKHFVRSLRDMSLTTIQAE